MSQSTSLNQYQKDEKDFSQGLLINFLGYFIKLAYPLTLIFITRFYGMEDWGVFVSAQAIILLLVRVIILGLDKGLVWWVAQSENSQKLSGFGILILWILGLNLLFLFPAIRWLAPWFCEYKEIPQSTASLQFLMLSLLPMILTEIFLGASMGLKKMGGQVFIKGTTIPLIFSVLAVLFYFSPIQKIGISMAHLISQIIGMGISLYYFIKLFQNRKAFIRKTLFDNSNLARLVRYSIPLWATEFVNSLLLRIDVLMLSGFVTIQQVGVWGIVNQFANAIRTVRRSFDPVVFAISSTISKDHNKERLRKTLNRANFWVSATQLPLYAFFYFFLDNLLLLYGPDFLQGQMPMYILGAFWILTSPLLLNSIIVNGYGKSNWTLLNVILTTLIAFVLLKLFIPTWGMNGAAWAMGLAYFAQSILGTYQMQRVTGLWFGSLKDWAPFFFFVPAMALSIYISTLSNTMIYSHISLGEIMASVVFVVVYGFSIYKAKNLLKIPSDA